MKNVHNNPEQIITDEQIVDYILGVSSQSEKNSILQALNSSEDVETRLNRWQEILFSLNASTEPVNPRARNWDAIERKLFENEKSVVKKLPWFKIFAPVMLSLVLAFYIGGYVYQTPSYGAIVMDKADDVMWWKIEAREKMVKVVSVSPMVMPNMKCSAWLQKQNGDWVMLGKVPDAGGNRVVQFTLPEGVSIKGGEKITIAVVDLSYDKPQPPKPNKMRSDVTLIEI